MFWLVFMVMTITLWIIARWLSSGSSYDVLMTLVAVWVAPGSTTTLCATLFSTEATGELDDRGMPRVDEPRLTGKREERIKQNV